MAARAAHVGCSGWNYRDWREAFYPKGVAARDWLEHYGATFDTVEVNSTFYRLASRDAVARWVEQTPADFTFAVKASRYLIHMKKLRGIADGIERFYERIEPLVEAGRLGPVLWQLPPWFARDDDRLAAALDLLPPGRHAWEFRDASWFAEPVYALLREHGCALAYGDDPARPFQEHVPTTDWAFVRFHRGRRGRRGNYSEAELQTWARRLRQWRRREELYLYFNNDWEAFAPRNAVRLRELLG